MTRQRAVGGIVRGGVVYFQYDEKDRAVVSMSPVALRLPGLEFIATYGIAGGVMPK